MFKRLSGLAALILTAVTTTALAASPTQAATDCTPAVHHGKGQATTQDGGTIAVTSAGLHMATPAQASRVRWTTMLGVEFADLEGVAYKTLVTKDGDRGFAAPAARVGLDTDADNAVDVTLVYEPYWNGTLAEGAWQSWDATVDTAKWWWAEEPGNPQTVRPWSEYRTEYADAIVLLVNVGMGTWNEGAEATVNNLSVSVKGECTVHTWELPSASPSPSPSETPTPAPSVTFVPGGGAGLPVTGDSVYGLAILGIALFGIGVLAVTVSGYRRARFHA